jgi:uncharacterized membrane protein
MMYWEKLNQRSNLFTILIAVALVLVFVFTLNKPPADEAPDMGYTADTVKAEVLSIAEEGSVQMGDVTQTYQIINLRVLEGQYEGQEFTTDYGRRYILPSDYLLRPGEKILVSVAQMPDGNTFVHFVDFVRTNSLIILGLFFVLVCVLVSGWKGVRSLLGIGVSVLVIIYFIVPRILNGQNPIMISLLGSFFFLTVTQYLVYGWTLKTHITMTAISVAILITGLMALFFVDLVRLNGMGDENAMYILTQYNQLNIKNLLIAGIMIGSLGILDDLVVGQTSAVIEIYRANPAMRFQQRFKRAMNVGRDHIAATVNTLVLAYLGASLSLFLLFSNSNVAFSTLMNFNYLAEEIVRSLVGTVGLFTAVPITTFIACWVVDDPHRLEKLVRVFGPLLNPSELHQEPASGD